MSIQHDVIVYNEYDDMEYKYSDDFEPSTSDFDVDEVVPPPDQDPIG